MKLFAGSASQELGLKLAERLEIGLSPVEHHIFPDGEQRVMLKESVVDEEVIIIQSTGIPTDIHYLELFFMIDAARRNGAKKITVIVPYVGYSRQDHVFRTGEARSLEVVARFMEIAGGNQFLSFDLHSTKIPEIFRKPMVHLSALPMFAGVIKELGFSLDDTVLASPDMGGLARLSKLSEMIGGMEQVAIEKNRDLTTGQIGAEVIHGNVKRRVLLIDDMISSGKTMVQAIDMLLSRGAEEVYIFATHAIFSGDAAKLLHHSSAKQIYVTDTIHVPQLKRFPKLEILSVAQSLADALR